MTLFDKDIHSVEDSTGSHRATISDNWSINGNPNGGYLMAIMAKAIMGKSKKMSTPIVTANYISRCTIGPADIFIEEISHTGQFQRFEVKLIQEGKEKVRAFATFAVEKTGCPGDRYETMPALLAPRNECIPVPRMPAYTLFDQIDVLLDPSCAGWMQNRLSDRSENKGWIKFRNGRRFDMPSLLLISDSLPPGILASQGMVTWVPTIELSVNIRNMPKTEWLNCSLRTRFVTCGLLEADGEVWDEAGNLVAISRQIAQVRKA